MPHDPAIPTLAIVGAGFSGTAIAVQLARQAQGKPVRIVLIEPSGKFGSGVAYGTRCTRHVLNVPAGNMSALPDEPRETPVLRRREEDDEEVVRDGRIGPAELKILG